MVSLYVERRNKIILILMKIIFKNEAQKTKKEVKVVF